MKTSRAILFTVAGVLSASTVFAQSAPMHDIDAIAPPVPTVPTAATPTASTTPIPGITVTPVAAPHTHLHLDTDALGSRIRLDGRDVGTDAIDIDVAPGEHSIDVSARGRAGYHTTVTLLAGENLSLAARLPRATDSRVWMGIGIGVGATALVATTIAVVLFALAGPRTPDPGTTGIAVSSIVAR